MTNAAAITPRLTRFSLSLALILAGITAEHASAEANPAQEDSAVQDSHADSKADANVPERRWRGDSRDTDVDSTERDRRRPMPEQLRAREYVEDVMMARLSKALELDDEESLLMMRRFKEHRETSMRLFRERHQQISALREAVDAKDETASVAALEALIALDKDLCAHRQALILDPGVELNQMQQARLYIFLADFEEGMRRILRQVHEQRDAKEADTRDEDKDAPGSNNGGREAAPGASDTVETE